MNKGGAWQAGIRPHGQRRLRGLRQYYADLSASGVFQDSAKLEPAKFRAAHFPNGIGLECFQLVDPLGVVHSRIKDGNPWWAQ